MKKVLLTILTVIVVAAALAGAGYTGYRIGFNNGATTSGNAPAYGRFNHMSPNLMPMQRFGNDFDYRAMPHSSYMTGRGNWFGYFTPFMFLGRIIFWALVIWFVYWLFTKSGWRITRQSGENTSPKTEE